jgi:hypothetical protein
VAELVENDASDFDVGGEIIEPAEVDGGFAGIRYLFTGRAQRSPRPAGLE